MTTPSPEQMQTQALEYVKQGQEALSAMVSTLSEALASVLRTAGGVVGAGGTGTGAGPAGMLPKPVEAVDQAFDISIQMLEAQRAFAHSLLDAAAPALRAAESAVDPTIDRTRTR